VRFFFDNCTAPALAKAIDVLIAREGDQAIHLQDRFARDIADVDWINTLAREGEWVVISGDERITRNPHERAAWLDSGLTAFFLSKGWQNLPFWDQAWKLVQRWPDISQQAKRIEAGAGFLVKPTSRKFEQVRVI